MSHHIVKVLINNWRGDPHDFPYISVLTNIVIDVGIRNPLCMCVYVHISHMQDSLNL